MLLERQEYIIEPAKNLLQLRNNLQIVDGLNEENMAYHVNLHEETMAILQERLMTTQNHKETFFLAGQRGSGKTTLVDYIFAQNSIKDTFETIKLSIHELTNIDDESFDVVEILVLLMTEILKRSPSSVTKKYKEEVAKIKENKLTAFKDNAQNHWNFSDFLLELITNTPFGLGMRIDASRRETIRLNVRNNLSEIRTLLDRLLLDYSTSLGNKKLLLFFDGLDKITEVKAIDSIFSRENAFVLAEIACRKVVMLPILSLYNNRGFSPAMNNLIMLEWRIRNNPLKSKSNELDEHAKQHQQILEDLIRKRIDDNSQSIVESDALQYAIQQSGGLTRQLFQLLDSALTLSSVAKSLVLRKESVEKARKNLSNNRIMRISLNPVAQKILGSVLEKHTVPENDSSDYQNTALRLVLDTDIIYNTNGIPYYFVNPLVEPLFKQND
jgi:hypothetical protein